VGATGRRDQTKPLRPSCGNLSRGALVGIDLPGTTGVAAAASPLLDDAGVAGGRVLKPATGDASDTNCCWVLASIFCTAVATGDCGRGAATETGDAAVLATLGVVGAAGVTAAGIAAGAAAERHLLCCPPAGGVRTEPVWSGADINAPWVLSLSRVTLAP